MSTPSGALDLARQFLDQLLEFRDVLAKVIMNLSAAVILLLGFALKPLDHFYIHTDGNGPGAGRMTVGFRF